MPDTDLLQATAAGLAPTDTAQTTSVPCIDAGLLRRQLLGKAALALLDIREARAFGQGHIPLSCHLPLSLLALQAPARLPNRQVSIVLCGDDDDAKTYLAQLAQATDILARLGYSRVTWLTGGIRAWRDSGGVLVDGYNSLVKAFADVVRNHYRVAAIHPDALRQRLRDGLPTTLVDVRTPAEHHFSTIRGSRNYPGTEWALRDPREPGSNPAHLWAVHCFSRTRGVIGTATLGLLHGPDVQGAWVDDGVMAWTLNGHPAQSALPSRDDIPAMPDDTAAHKALALIQSHGLDVIDTPTLQRWLRDDTRSVYVFDLRPGAVDRGGIIAIPGGQLLMNYENHVLVRHAHVVLLDAPHRLRAAVTAFWLQQLGQAHIHILDQADTDSVQVPPPPAWRIPDDDASLARIAAAQLDALKRRDAAKVVDVGASADYIQAHVPGAAYAVASALDLLVRAWRTARQTGRILVLTSRDGAQAAIAAHALLRADALVAPEGNTASGIGPEPADGLAILAGGTQGWQAAGLPVLGGWQEHDLWTPFLDDWGSTMRVPPQERAGAYRAYLDWEGGLVARLAADATVRFALFPLDTGNPVALAS